VIDILRAAAAQSLQSTEFPGPILPPIPIESVVGEMLSPRVFDRRQKP